MLEANSRYSIDTYTTRLEQKGYSPGSILSYVRALEHFFQWLETKGVPMEDATNNHVDLFLYRHLPQCRCAPPAPTRIQTVRAAIHQWFAVVGVKPDELALGDTKSRRIATAIKAYDNYLKDLAGLRDSTRQYRRRYVLELL